MGVFCPCQLITCGVRCGVSLQGGFLDLNTKETDSMGTMLRTTKPW